MSAITAVSPVIYTRSACRINPLAPGPGEIVIEDIAHALALCNRFAGHTRRPISVAQHSVYAAGLTPQPHTLQALLHDAAEAYLGDVTKWVKASPEMAHYRACEDRVQRNVYREFGCAEEDHELVRYADRVLVRYEGLKGFGPDWRVLGTNPTAGSDYADLTDDEVARCEGLFNGWHFWPWEVVEDRFLLMFHDLYGLGE